MKRFGPIHMANTSHGMPIHLESCSSSFGISPPIPFTWFTADPIN